MTSMRIYHEPFDWALLIMWHIYKQCSCCHLHALHGPKKGGVFAVQQPETAWVLARNGVGTCQKRRGYLPETAWVLARNGVGTCQKRRGTCQKRRGYLPETFFGKRHATSLLYLNRRQLLLVPYVGDYFAVAELSRYDKNTPIKVDQVKFSNRVKIHLLSRIAPVRIFLVYRIASSN